MSFLDSLREIYGSAGAQPAEHPEVLQFRSLLDSKQFVAATTNLTSSSFTRLRFKLSPNDIVRLFDGLIEQKEHQSLLSLLRDIAEPRPGVERTTRETQNIRIAANIDPQKIAGLFDDLINQGDFDGFNNALSLLNLSGAKLASAITPEKVAGFCNKLIDENELYLAQSLIKEVAQLSFWSEHRASLKSQINVSEVLGALLDKNRIREAIEFYEFLKNDRAYRENLSPEAVSNLIQKLSVDATQENPLSLLKIPRFAKMPLSNYLGESKVPHAAREALGIIMEIAGEERLTAGLGADVILIRISVDSVFDPHFLLIAPQLLKEPLIFDSYANPSVDVPSNMTEWSPIMCDSSDAREIAEVSRKNQTARRLIIDTLNAVSRDPSISQAIRQQAFTSYNLLQPPSSDPPALASN